MSNALAAFGTLLKMGGTTIAEVTAITPPGLARDAIEVTHHQSPGAWRERIKGLKDGGEVTFSINYIPTDSTHNASTGILADFATDTVDPWSVVFPDGTTWSFPAMVTSAAPDAPIDDKLSAEITLQICGQPTLA